MLCDHAEAAESKLFINGGAINLLWVAPQPPHVVTFAVAAVVQVPYNATNQAHTITVRLLDEDGNPVVPWVPEGVPDQPAPIQIEVTFNVGRPPVLTPGEAQALPFAFNLQGLPLSRLGLYSAVVELDGAEVRRLPFRLLVQQ